MPDLESEFQATAMRMTLARPVAHGRGSAKPIQKTASTGSTARLSTAPILRPCQSSQAEQKATRVAAQNRRRSPTKVLSEVLADQGPLNISNKPKKRGS
jgi:hypothetical protein